MPHVTLQIREEERLFFKKDLAEALEISKSKLNKLIDKGRLPHPTGRNNRFTTDDLVKAFKSLSIPPCIKINPKTIEDWIDTIECKYTLVDNGIFAVSPSVTGDPVEGIEKMIEDYGIWNAQGLNNHEHMDYFTDNPIMQHFLAENLITSIIRHLPELKTDQKVVIYNNGPRNSEVCVYLAGKDDEAFHLNHDRYLRIKKVKVTERIIG
jgi:hypothetical protein